VTIQVSKWPALYGCSGFNVGCMAFLTPLFGRVRPWRERSYGVAALPSDWDDAAKNEAMRRVAAEPIATSWVGQSPEAFHLSCIP
jgi:hypothetical protein